MESSVSIHLTPTERQIAELLASNATVTSKAIAASLWGHRHNGGPLDLRGNIAVHLNRLRAALKPLGVEVRLVERGSLDMPTVYGVPTEQRAILASALMQRMTDKLVA